MNRIFLLLLLIAANWMLSIQPKPQIIFPYIPPFTHTPGMGISMIGVHSQPPSLFLNQLLQLTQRSCQECPRIEENIHQELREGMRLRLLMQSQTIELLSLLPSGAMENALRERDENEVRIGEVLLWNRL